MSIDLTPLEGDTNSTPSIFVDNVPIEIEHRYPLCEISSDTPMSPTKMVIMKKYLSKKPLDSGIQIWCGEKMLGYCYSECWYGFLKLFDYDNLTVLLDENTPLDENLARALG